MCVCVCMLKRKATFFMNLFVHQNSKPRKPKPKFFGFFCQFIIVTATYKQKFETITKEIVSGLLKYLSIRSRPLCSVRHPLPPCIVLMLPNSPGFRW